MPNHTSTYRTLYYLTCKKQRTNEQHRVCEPWNECQSCAAVGLAQPIASQLITASRLYLPLSLQGARGGCSGVVLLVTGGRKLRHQLRVGSLFHWRRTDLEQSREGSNSNFGTKYKSLTPTGSSRNSKCFFVCLFFGATYFCLRDDRLCAEEGLQGAGVGLRCADPRRHVWPRGRGIWR